MFQYVKEPQKATLIQQPGSSHSSHPALPNNLETGWSPRIQALESKLAEALLSVESILVSSSNKTRNFFFHSISALTVLSAKEDPDRVFCFVFLMRICFT